ncbi:uncharacterized protein A4U43_C07F2220 [Asparagus officinalis]|uniref:Uncharacterized protein n=1 Tax=Asparagus officinalis TaxID=4686 RepID=A0A5P1E8X3_ASPOF|nr:beta-glucuronosyltransferase GlcAT14B [Asparagus officinalis]ONK62274.1 uncharacterized protein A4U43_C07F2220 [Asparagus officinalis]
MRKPHQHRLLATDLIALLLLLTPLLILTLTLIPTSKPPQSPTLKPPKPPKLAYLISGSSGDGSRVKRVLRAVYHPLNLYLVRLDPGGGDEERADLKRFVRSERVFAEFGNVRVLEDADHVTSKGPTVVAMVLHAVAVLLKEGKEWSWFVNLSAEDYPLMPQDDLLHVFSYLPRDLNFIEHTSDMGWKENERARPMIVDPGLYGSNKKDIFWVKDKRSMPSSFKLFVGSSSMILARPFLEFCIWGWDNLPRTLLMYYTNYLLSSEGYFHTVICNSQEFQNTTINHDLHFVMWDNHHQPLNLTPEHFDLMINSGAPFGRGFTSDDLILDRIDSKILRRPSGGFTPGGWCLGSSLLGKDPCGVNGKPSVLRPTLSSKRLEKLLVKLLDAENFRPKQCI